MREAATRAVTFSAGRSRADLDHDDMLVLALTKLVEIVGEAAKHVGAETRSRFPDVPWSDAARTRDRLTHHYFEIDLDVLWQTVTADLPDLLCALEDSSNSGSVHQ
ncbi:MAG: HepT-like ribonuclease domain-containing protein [Pseudonocardiaceae bacterium]